MQLTSEAPASFRSSAERPGPLGLVREGIGDILSRRRLILYLVQADLRKKGADSLLGNIWWVLDPLLQMLVYVVLVSVIFARAQDAYPLFIFSAILPWKWFQSSIQDGTGSVVGQERLIKQIHFPKIVLPVASVVAGIANFAFGMIPLFGLLLLFYRDHLSPWILLIPVIAVVQFVFTLPVAMVLGACNVFYRDIANVSRHVLRLWFYLSPALYSSAQVTKIAANHPEAALVFGLNPFTVLFESYRAVIYDDVQPSWIGLGALLLVSFMLLGACTYVFKRMEPSFAKVL